jgi:hypothetical protein
MKALHPGVGIYRGEPRNFIGDQGYRNLPNPISPRQRRVLHCSDGANIERDMESAKG